MENNNLKIKILREAETSIEEGNIKKAEILLKGYLDYNKKDPDVSVILARIYSQQGALKKALELLKDQSHNYFSVFKELSQLYIKLERYDKLYNLWSKNKNRPFQDLNTNEQVKSAQTYLRRLQVFLKTFVNKTIETPPNLNYKEKQYIKYDYKKAIEHISSRHITSNNKTNSNTGSIFYNYYDLEELFLAASRNIEFEKREIKLEWDFSDSYIFKFRKIGISDGHREVLNYFRVATIPNTNKIITMFPVRSKRSYNPCLISKEEILPICNSIVHSDLVYRVKTYSLTKK